MTDTISAVIQALNRVVWGAPALLLILGVGLYFSLRTRFLQVRKLGFSLGTIWHKLREKPEAGGVSPFQAVCTALAATVGTGNIVGVAAALVSGGPGALVWMELAALLLDVKPGDDAILLGQSETCEVTPDSLSADTEYGVNGWTTCQITARVPRIYVYNGQVVETRMLFC